jgi:4'-phosphopantetheinyl transferase
MPLIIYQKDISDHARLAVWKISESNRELLDILEKSGGSSDGLSSVKLEKRQREWLITQILLDLMARGKTLTYLENGKPMLSHNLHLSLSHCGEMAGLVVSDKPVGLDIQGVDEKLFRIKNKFCHPSELKNLPDGPTCLEHLTVLWSVKEAVFKFFGENVHFAKDIITLPFHYEQPNLRAEYKGIHGEITFNLTNISMDGYHIIATI